MGAVAMMFRPRRRTRDSTTSASRQSSSGERPRHRPRHDLRWESYFSSLCAFRREHGHCLVTTKNCTGVFPRSLVNWVRSVRLAYREERLSDDRIHRLEEQGFVWWVGQGRGGRVDKNLLVT